MSPSIGVNVNGQRPPGLGRENTIAHVRYLAAVRKFCFPVDPALYRNQLLVGVNHANAVCTNLKIPAELFRRFLFSGANLSR
ncbi:hypothetical protein JNB88_09415 [Rhizobium cauense]|uniref:hypothetical protein n=1 Tax=Rhizobium cauense TaxID=1166683 RepID=UPI001C6E809E|nr:hypothetical protein [Rhizobium cauense]MBW9113853.1 hypothetical protein [Rhizobium cauense]